MTWDVFISHASEDKEEIAHPLAEALRAKGLDVWYADFTLKIGESLRQSIDNGLSKSRYGVVVLSKSFFSKHWPQSELDGLFSMESAEKKRILPVWHNVTVNDVKQFSPILAGRVAIPTSEMNHLVLSIADIVSTYSVMDHHGCKWEKNVLTCESHGVPNVPSWIETDPKRISSDWLAERLTAGAELRLYHDPAWCDGTWFVVDIRQDDGEVVNLEQLRDVMPPIRTSATTTSAPR